MKIQPLVLAVSVIMLMSCTTSSSKQAWHSDPLERFNRSMYNFNFNVLDPYVVRPISIAWRNYIPQSARNGLRNFTSNLEEPAIMVNYFLQGDPYHGMIHFTRFFLNTLLGIAGFIDVADITNQKLQREQPHRFGSTLRYYGINYNPYIHLPFYGSFTVRDDGGNMVDTLYPILSWLTWPLLISKWAIEGIEIRASLLDFDNLLRQSLDPYVTLREAYFQKYNFLANNNKITSKINLNTKDIENELSEIDAE